jgi:hypothetical protein
MAGCGMSFLTKPSASASLMRGHRSRTGPTITISGILTRRWASHTGGLPRQPHRNMRWAAHPRSAPPITRCSHRATRRKTRRGSNHRWMKVRWQVNMSRPFLRGRPARNRESRHWSGSVVLTARARDPSRGALPALSRRVPLTGRRCKHRSGPAPSGSCRTSRNGPRGCRQP